MQFNNLIALKNGAAYKHPIMLILAGYSFLILMYGFWGAVRDSHDQRSFFETSRLILQGDNPYALSLQYIRENMPHISLEGLDANGGRSMYPPSAHILFIPFYSFLMSPQAGKIAWLACNLLFLVIIYCIFSKRYLYKFPPMYKYIFACLLIGASSTKTNLSLGQTALFSLSAFLLSISISNALLSGLCLTFAVSKPSLMVLFCCFLLARRRYITIAIALLMHLCLTWIAALWLSIPMTQLINDYTSKVYLLTSFESAVSFLFQTNGASLKTLFYLLHIPAQAVTMLTMALYALAFICIYMNRNMSEIRLLGLIAIMTVLIDYHQHYDFSILLFMFPMLACSCKDKLHMQWPLIYYMLLMYLPNFSRINFFVFETGTFFMAHPVGLLCWQIFYTSLFLALFWIYAKHSSPGIPEQAILTVDNVPDHKTT